MFSRARKPQPVSEDVLKQLVNYEVIVLMDDSGSMMGKNWKHVRNSFLPTLTGTDAILRIRRRQL